MGGLRAETVLRRASDLLVRVTSAGGVQILLGGATVECGPRGLAILDAFSQPRSLNDALERLDADLRGAQDWVDLTSTIVQLHRAGILAEDGGGEPLADDLGSWADRRVHVRLLRDRARTSSFLAAIDEVVREGDVVVDIGTGTGVLAVAAARAGARHVYAIEAASIRRGAEAVFEANGLADRITLLEGWSTLAELPEPADVLVSELLGHEPLAEHVLEVTLDARKRFLKPNARVIPRAVRVFASALSIPSGDLASEAFTEENVEEWREWYGIDFGPLTTFAFPQKDSLFLASREVLSWPTLSDPVLLVELELEALAQFQVDATAGVRAIASGRLNGVAGFFELELGPTCRFSMRREIAESTSWRVPVWLVAPPLSVNAGDVLSLRYRHRVAGEPDGLTVERPGVAGR